MTLPRHSPIISSRPCRLIAWAQGWARLGTSTCCAKTCLHCLVALYLQKITANVSYFVAGTSHLQTITLNVCWYEEMTSYRHTPALNLYSSRGSDIVPAGHSLHIWRCDVSHMDPIFIVLKWRHNWRRQFLYISKRRLSKKILCCSASVSNRSHMMSK